MTLVDLDRLFRLFARAKALCQHSDYVVVGSNSVMALAPHTSIPAEMTMSIDVDAFTRADPGRIFDLADSLGEHSAFSQREGFYLDPVRPSLPTLPAGWESRLIPVERDGVRIFFLDPDDAAISKYARGEPRDHRWIRAGVAGNIISLPRVKQRLSSTRFADEDERTRAHSQVDKDHKWLVSLNKPAHKP